MLDQSGRRGTGAAIAALLATTAIAYAPAIGGDFYWDDNIAVLTKPTVVDPSRFGWRDFVPPSLGRDRPLTDLTFALNHATTGGANAPFVATNVAIHLAAVVLAWVFVRKVLRRASHPQAEMLAVVSAALFALHPMQTEAVSYVSQRAESLASALYLAALVFALRAEEEHPGRRWVGWAAASVAAFLAAVAAKPIGITAPFAFLTVVALTGPRKPRGAGFWSASALIGLVTVALGVATLEALGDASDAGLSAGDLGPWRYLLTEAWVIVRYVALLFWPPSQSIDHEVRTSPGLADPVTLLHLALVIGLLAGTIRLALAGRRSGNAAAAVSAVGILMFFIVLAPTSSFVPLADPMAEHRTYLANLGLFMAMVTGANELLGSARARIAARRTGPAIVALVLVALTASLVHRNRMWHDSLALWSDAARKAPSHFRPHLHVANSLRQAGRRDEALEEYRNAVRLVPFGQESWVITHRALGSALASSGRVEEAVSVLQNALARVPGDVGLSETLAWTRYSAGDRTGAAAVVEHARLLGSDSAELAAIAGKTAADRGDLPTALRELRRAVALAPTSPYRRSDLAIVAKTAGLDDVACKEISRFVALERDAAARAEGERLEHEWGCRLR